MTEDNGADSAIRCPVCGDSHAAHYCDVDGYHFQKCPRCAFVFLHPMPSETALESIYNNDGAITPTFYPKAGSRFRRALRMAMRLYPYARGRELLDVGCGGGFQAGAFRWLGVKASGLDISSDSIAYAKQKFKKCQFYCEEFESFLNNKKKYGFIFSSEVIEHVLDVNEYMIFLNKILENDGYIFVTTPDMGHPDVPKDVTRWDVFNPPRHVQFFCQANLESLFERHGFRPVRRFTDKKMGLRMLFHKT